MFALAGDLQRVAPVATSTIYVLSGVVRTIQARRPCDRRPVGGGPVPELTQEQATVAEVVYA